MNARPHPRTPLRPGQRRALREFSLSEAETLAAGMVLVALAGVLLALIIGSVLL